MILHSFCFDDSPVFHVVVLDIFLRTSAARLESKAEQKRFNEEEQRQAKGQKEAWVCLKVRFVFGLTWLQVFDVFFGYIILLIFLFSAEKKAGNKPIPRKPLNPRICLPRLDSTSVAKRKALVAPPARSAMSWSWSAAKAPARCDPGHPATARSAGRWPWP